MRWTYDKVRRYGQCQRRRARRLGCRECGKMVPTLELAGSPPLAQMARDGYGIERIKTAIRERGWFCRGCVRGLTRKQAESDLRGWRKKQQQQQQLQCLEEINKRDWSEDQKWDYVYNVGGEEIEAGARDERAREVWAEGELKAALEIIKDDY